FKLSPTPVKLRREIPLHPFIFSCNQGYHLVDLVELFDGVVSVFPWHFSSSVDLSCKFCRWEKHLLRPSRHPHRRHPFSDHHPRCAASCGPTRPRRAARPRPATAPWWACPVPPPPAARDRRPGSTRESRARPSLLRWNASACSPAATGPTRTPCLQPRRQILCGRNRVGRRVTPKGSRH